MSEHATGLLQIAQPVQDVERAVRFYRDAIGLPFLFQAGPLAFFDLGGVRLMLSVPEDERFAHPGSVLYLRTGNVDAAYRALLHAGATTEGEPHVVHRDERHELWMAFFHDTEGNMLAFAEERPLR